jgi:hypothetical protein
MAFTAMFLAAIALAVPAQAQELLPSQDIPEANRLMDAESKARNSLKCDIFTRFPFVDFDFRYVSRYHVSAPWTEFAPDQRLTVLLRISPAQGKPVLLAHSFRIQPVPPEMNSSFRPKSAHVRISGGFAVGDGPYLVELLLYDDRGRIRYKRWRVAATYDRKEAMMPALGPSTVVPLVADHWDSGLDPNGFRLTVLLDATAASAFASDLHERFLLLQLLTSLLREVPCKSATVVAFNLDQQREIFREENFDAQGFARLSTALKDLQLAVVPYQALRRGNSAKFLASLVEKQNSAQQSADAVIFIGSNTHVREKQRTSAQEPPDAGTSHFYYFEYLGFHPHFPDTIDYLTRDLRGRVFLIDSVSDFSAAIAKLRAKLGTAKQTQNSTSP